MEGFERVPHRAETNIDQEQEGGKREALSYGDAFLELQAKVLDELFPNKSEFAEWIGSNSEVVDEGGEKMEVPNGEILRSFLENSGYVEKYVVAQSAEETKVP